MRIPIASGLLAFLGLAAAGAIQAQVPAVAGAGSRSCEQMQTDISDLPNVRRAYVSWMQGYLSGRNAVREAANLPLIDLADFEGQWDWVVEWCVARPQQSFATGVDALFASLETQSSGT